MPRRMTEVSTGYADQFLRTLLKTEISLRPLERYSDTLSVMVAGTCPGKEAL